MKIKNLKWLILMALGVVSILVTLIYIKKRDNLTHTPIATDKRENNTLMISQLNSEEAKVKPYISNSLDKKRNLNDVKIVEMTFEEVDNEISILNERISNEKIVEHLNSSNDPELLAKAQALFSKLTELRRIKLEKGISALDQKISDLETEFVR